MTKKLWVIAGLMLGLVVLSCNKPRRSPGRVYMPDMYYSQAHETYSSTEGLKQRGVNYNSMPVAGTVAKDDMPSFPFGPDSAGYKAAAGYKNPLDSATNVDMKEAERLYLIYCGICHGSKLDGNGPLYNGGNGAFSAKPATLVGDVLYENMTAGTMFHAVTYGKGAMGSYASQLSPAQRWQVISFIKAKQAGKAAGTAAGDSTGVRTDTTAVKPN